jgi:hypothetical protein
MAECRIDLVMSAYNRGGGNFDAGGSACKPNLFEDLFRERIRSIH